MPPSVKNRELASNMAEIIRNSVMDTITTMFNVPIDVCAGIGKAPSKHDYVCISELVQDNNERGRLMFVFEHELIEKLVHRVFSANDLQDPGIYESAALEIVNVVGNNVKMYLNVRGYRVEMMIPHVPDHTAPTAAEDPFLQLAFSLQSDAAMGIDLYLRTA